MEIGTASGAIIHYFRDMGYNVCGVDLDEGYVTYGKETYNLNIQTGTIHTIKNIAPPDLIIYSHSLEHLLFPNDDLHKAYELLPNNGLLFIEVPGVKNIVSKHHGNFLNSLQIAHIYYFTLNSLTNLLSLNGFKLIDGNEHIMAVFKKNGINSLYSKRDNNYVEVLNYLKNCEKKKHYFRIRHFFFKIIISIRSYLIRLSKRIIYKIS